VSFKCTGDIGSGSIQLRSHTDVEKPENNVEIDLTEPVSLTFSLKYLVNFCKASGMSDQVKLCLSNEVPLLVEYGLQSNSYLRFYLAPKVTPRNHVYLPTFTNQNRSVTRSKCFMITKRNERHVFRIHVGFSGALFFYACSVYRVQFIRGVRLASCASAELIPGLRAGINPADVTRRAISDNEKNQQYTLTLPTLACIIPVSSFLPRF
jgi:hypothetical protein